MTLQEALDTLRRFQRHRLLREFDDAGQVPAENMEVSNAIDMIIDEALPVSGSQPKHSKE